MHNLITSFAGTAHTPVVYKQNRQWWKRVRELELIARELGRLPRAPDEAIPSTLLMWVRNQRRNSHLTPEQQQALEQVEGWSWAPREDAWGDRLAEVARFFVAHGRAPRVRAADAEEAALGLWVARQRRAADTRAMPYARLALWSEFVSQLETDDLDS